MSNVEHIEDDTLQRLFDGEATEGELAEFAERLDTKLEQARLERLGRVGDLVRMHADDAEATLDAETSNALFDQILGGVQEAEKETPRLRVIQGQKRQRAGVAAALAVAIAAAVALAFYLRPPATEEPTVAETDHPFDTSQEVLVHDTHHVEVHAPGGSEVEDIDFGGNTGTIFQVPGEHGQPLAVVWIDDAETP